MSQDSQNHAHSLKNSGLSLLEILVVISLVAVVYAVAMPNLGITSTTTVATKLGRLSSDIRSAFDMAVLHRRPYRLVFELRSGRYWLESTERQDFRLGDQKLERDQSREQLRDELEAFTERFAAYEEAMGESIKDYDNDREIPMSSPLIKAKPRLEPVEWKQVKDPEWDIRFLGPELIIQNFLAEHHEKIQSLEDFDDRDIVALYVLPSGYIERAIAHIAYRVGEAEADTQQPPYTLKVDPYQGTAEIISGAEEMELE